MVATLLKTDALGPKAKFNALVLKDLLDGGRDIFVVARNYPVAHFHDSDFAAEATVNLCELQSNVTAAGDDQMFWQGIQFHDGRVGHVIDIFDAGDVTTFDLAALR